MNLFILDIATLKDALESLGEENENLQKTINKQVEDVVLLSGKEESLNNQLTILQNDRESKSKQIDQLLLEASQFVFDRENKLAELSTVQSERDNLKKHLESLEDKLTQCDQKINGFESIVSQQKEKLQCKDDALLEKEQYVSKVREINLELTEKDKEINGLKDKLEAAKSTNNENSGNIVLNNLKACAKCTNISANMLGNISVNMLWPCFFMLCLKRKYSCLSFLVY